MSSKAAHRVEAARARRRALGDLGSLHGFHWLVIGLSLLVTSSAWWFSKSLVEERSAARFERETDHLVELVTERMNRYADALESGVAAIAARGGDIDRDAWRAFAATLDVEHRYPGVTGIGVIRRASAEGLADLVARERLAEPTFDIHPVVDAPQHFPVVHVEPLARNRRALGLDLVHEPRRLAAVLEAIRSGRPTISAPLVLVQDTSYTPGFVFLAPWWSDAGDRDTKSVDGLVVAPFTIRSLMRDVLDDAEGQVRVAIADAGETIHDEHDPDARGHDPDPLFTRVVEVPVHGRLWRFDFRSNLAFRAAVAVHQPTLVLLGGIVIDLMLIALFLGMSRANRAMERIADLNVELESRAAALAESNLDLERFACVVSHDLKTPLRGIGDLAWYLEEDLAPVLGADDAPPDVERNLARLHTQVRRMNALIEGILDYSAAGTDALHVERIDTRAVFEGIGGSLGLADGQLVLDGSMPVLESCPARFEQVMGNLVGNAFVHHPDRASAVVRVHVSRSGMYHRFAIADDGAGIDPRFRERIFDMFETLKPKDAVESTGVGLSIVRKSVDGVGGTVHVESSPDGGATFVVDWPNEIPRSLIERRDTGLHELPDPMKKAA